MFTDKICYTCLSKEHMDLIDVQKKDIDKMSYIQKLTTCLSDDLTTFTTMKMCRPCIKHLRISYEFLKMVRKTQESLKSYSKHNRSVESIVKDEQIVEDEESVKVSAFKGSDNVNESDNSDFFLFGLKNDAVGESWHRCDKCNVCFDIYVGHSCEIKEEIIIDYDEPVNEEIVISEINSKQNELEKATKKVRNKSSQSATDITHECQHCRQIFFKRWQLKKHIARVHVEEKKFVCSYCHRAFKESYHLREHLTKHTGERNYACTVCDKKFLRASSLRRHIKSHEAPPGQKTKRTPFLCTICGKSFPFSNGVQRHMRIHLGIRKHECQLCKRRFTQSTHLYVHMRTHTGEKPYICDMCGEAFSLNVSLQKHISIHNNPFIEIKSEVI